MWFYIFSRRVSNAQIVPPAIRNSSKSINRFFPIWINGQRLDCVCARVHVCFAAPRQIYLQSLMVSFLLLLTIAHWNPVWQQQTKKNRWQSEFGPLCSIVLYMDGTVAVSCAYRWLCAVTSNPVPVAPTHHSIAQFSFWCWRYETASPALVSNANEWQTIEIATSPASCIQFYIVEKTYTRMFCQTIVLFLYYFFAHRWFLAKSRETKRCKLWSFKLKCSMDMPMSELWLPTNETLKWNIPLSMWWLQSLHVGPTKDAF